MFKAGCDGDRQYRLLAQLRHRLMPVHFDAQDDIDCVHALSAGKLVEARLPEVEFRRQGTHYAGPATVMKLTALGRQLAEKYERERPARRFYE